MMSPMERALIPRLGWYDGCEGLSCALCMEMGLLLEAICHCRYTCEDGGWGQDLRWQSHLRHGLHASFCPWPPSTGGSMLISAVCCFFLFFGNSESAMIGWQCLFCGTSIAAWNALDVITVELYPTNQRSVLSWPSLWDLCGLYLETYLLQGPPPWPSWYAWCYVEQMCLRLLSFSCVRAGIGLQVGRLRLDKVGWMAKMQRMSANHV